MRTVDADALRHWIEGECKSPSIPRNEAAFGKRILMHMETMKSEDIQPVVHGEWIPCSDRLPKDEYVLISKKPQKYIGGDRWCVSIAIRIADPRSGKIQWRDSGFGVIQDDKVLAWMPLPEPYKEGEQNG